MTAGQVGGATTKPATIYTVLKLFDCREYAEAFLRGHLYMNTVEHFRTYRDKAGELRGDSYEGIAGIFQPSQLGPITLGPHEISPSDLSGPLLIHRHEDLRWNVFCMYSLNTRGLADAVSGETLADFKTTLKIHEKCFGLGEHIVLVMNRGIFQQKVADAIRKSQMEGAMSLVNYYDEDTFHGLFDQERVPFQKRKLFEHQREYRIAVRTTTSIGSPLTLKIGDISDIALLTTLQEFNEKLELRLPDGSRA